MPYILKNVLKPYHPANRSPSIIGLSFFGSAAGTAASALHWHHSIFVGGDVGDESKAKIVCYLQLRTLRHWLQ